MLEAEFQSPPTQKKSLPPGPNSNATRIGSYPQAQSVAPTSLPSLSGDEPTVPWYAPTPLRVVGALQDAATSQTEGGYVPYDQRLQEYQEKEGQAPPNPFLTGAQAGFLGGFAGDVGFAETIADVIPGDPGKESFKAAGDFLEGEAYKYPMRTLRDIRSFGDAAGYLGQATGYMFGYIGSMIPTALATGGVGAAARIAGKSALKSATKREIASKGAQAIARVATVPSIIKNTGHTYRGVREETGVESPGIAIPVGIASGMLERFGIGKTFESFFDALPAGEKKKIWREMMAGAVKGAGRSALVEGGTELAQESLQLVANRLADSTYDIVNGENVWRVLDAAAMGAFGSAPIGAIGGAGNYYTAVKEESDRKTVQTVLEKLDELNRLQSEGSEIQFNLALKQLQKESKLLEDEETIPKKEQLEALQRLADRIETIPALNDTQRKALQDTANNLLSRYKERVGTLYEDAEASEAQAQSDLETAARENKEAAATQAGQSEYAQPEVDPRQSSILPEENAPYNTPDAQYQKGQQYYHRIVNAAGEVVEVEATITDVGKNGDVLESVVSSSVNDADQVPLIVTRRRKTRVFRTQQEAESEMNFRRRDPDDPKYAKSSQERNAELEILRSEIEKNKAQAEISETLETEAGATIKGPKKRTVEQNIEAREKQEAKKPLTQAKPSRFRKTYKRGIDPAEQTGRTSESRFNAIIKTISNSAIIEVGQPGEKRKVGAIQKVELLEDFGSNERKFLVDVLYEDGTEQITISESMGDSALSNGGVIVFAKNKKTTKEQEAKLAEAENQTDQQVDTQTKSKQASYSSIFEGGNRRSTKEASPHEKRSKTTSLKLDKEAVTNPKPKEEPKEKGIITGRALDDDIARDQAAIKQQIKDDSGIVMDVTAALPYAIKRITNLLKLIALDIKQAIRDARSAGDERELNSKTRKTKRQGSLSYADLKKEIVFRYVKELSEIDKDNVSAHLPQYGDDPEKFIGGLFDAVVNEGPDSFKEGEGINFDQVIAGVQEKLLKYIDFQAKDPKDPERTIIAANSNVYKGTDTGFRISWNGRDLELLSDDMSESFSAVLDFSSQKGNVVSIKAPGKKMDALSYRLKKEALEQVRFQTSNIEGREDIVTFAHIPESLLFDENGNFQYQNWEYETGKGGPRFLKDISWSGLDREVFIKQIKKNSKSKRIKRLLSSEGGEQLFTSKEQIAGIIANAIALVKDPRYLKLKKKKTKAFRDISEVSGREVAYFKIVEIPALLESAITLHLDHFATITENQINEVEPSLSELNSLTAYYNKLNATIEGDVPQTIDLPKMGTVVDTGRKGKDRYEIQNDPSNPNNLKTKENINQVPLRDRYFSFAANRSESMFSVPKTWIRQSLRQEDLKLAKEIRDQLKERIDRLKKAVSVQVGIDEKTITLQASILPAIARRLTYEAKQAKLGDIDLVMEGEGESEVEYIDQSIDESSKAVPIRVTDALSIVESIKGFIEKGSEYDDVLSNIWFYSEGIELETEKFTASYKSILPLDISEEVDLAQEASDMVNKMGVEAGGETAATGEVSPSDVLQQSESEAEAERFKQGEYSDQDTPIGRANKRWREARGKMVALIQSNNLEELDFTKKLLGYQAQMMESWNEFLRLRGTDFLTFEGSSPMVTSGRAYDLYKELREENVNQLKASSIFESKEDKLERFLAKFDKAEELQISLADAFIAANKEAGTILSQIKKSTQAFLDRAKQTEDGLLLLQDLGWAGPRGGVKKLTNSDVSIEAVLANPEKFAEPESSANYVDFGGLTYDTTLKLSDLKLDIDPYKKAKTNRDALASAVTLFDEEMGFMLGFGDRIMVTDVLSKKEIKENEFNLIKRKGAFMRSSDEGMTSRDAIIYKRREKELAKEIAAYQDEGKSGSFEAKKARRERKQLNKLLSAYRATMKARGTRKKFGLTQRKLKKRGAYFKVIFDSFYKGGARAMDPGRMFGTLITLSNKFNEDQYREEGSFVQVPIKGTDRVETPATVYYKLYKIYELRDPFKILEHPIFSSSAAYLGPVKPDNLTEDQFLERKERVRSKIVEQIDALKSEIRGDENAARKEFVKRVILKSIFDEFIQVFTHEAGMIDRESIVKKVTDLNTKTDDVLSWLQKGLDLPFRPPIEEEAESEAEQTDISELADRFEAAGERKRAAEKAYSESRDVIDRVKRGARGIAMERGAGSFKGVQDELAELQAKSDEIHRELRESNLEYDKLKLEVEAIEKGDKATLSIKSGQESSLDRIPSKYLSSTIEQTMPYGYTTVKSDRPSIDMPMDRSRPWDAALAEEGVESTTEVKELGSSIGADGIAQLLEDNRPRLGDAFVDKAIAFLGNIPDKYLNELTLNITTSLRSDKGVNLGGSFMEAIKAVFIPVEGNTSDSFVHEMSHYLHAFLPADMQQRISDMRRDALRGVLSGTEDGALRYRLEIAEDILSNVNSTEQFGIEKFEQYLDQYGDRAKDMYHLINDNEFFAYIMTKEGQDDLTNLTPQNNPIGFVARAKQFLSDLIDWVFKKARFVSAEKQFVDEVVSKFKSGEFSVERMKFKAGPELDASIMTAKELNRAIDRNVRTAVLGPEGANVEAGQRVSYEAGSFHNMIYDLSQKIMKDMSEEDEFRNLMGKTKFKEGEFVTDLDDVTTVSKRASFWAGVSESEAIRKILEENEETTKGVIFSAEGYLKLAKIRERNPDAIPESMWQQVSKEFFKNTEEYLIAYRKIKEKSDKVKSDDNVSDLLALMSEVKSKFDTKDAAKKSALSFKAMVRSMFSKVKERAAETEAIERLKQYGFDLNQLTSQLDDKLVGPEIFKVIEDFYNQVWFNEDAQIILHKGINRDGEKATWKDLVFTYIVEKGIHQKYLGKKDLRPYRTRGKGIIKTNLSLDDDMEAMFAEVPPIVKFAADHILKKQQNDLLLNEVSEQQLRESFEAYTEYEKEIADLFDTDEEFVTRGGKSVIRKVDGQKKAIDKLLKDYNSATGDLAVANRLFLSIRRSVLAKIKKRNDAIVAAEIAGRIVESEEFSTARKEAAKVIDAKPEVDIDFDTEKIYFPHPDPEKNFALEQKLSDKKGREEQLKKLSIYIQDLNDWMADNPDDAFLPAWTEIRERATAQMLSPTMRSGQTMKSIINVGILRPLQNTLASVGTFTSKMAMTHLDNWALTLERAMDWREKHQAKMAKALMNAAVSHGFDKGPIGVSDWVNVIGKRYFASANQTGKLIKEGEVITNSDLTDVKTITKEDVIALELQVQAFGELFNMDVKEGRGKVIAPRRIKEPLRRRGGKERFIARKPIQDTPTTLPKTFDSVAMMFANRVGNLFDSISKELEYIDTLEDMDEKEKREAKLLLYTKEDNRGDSLVSKISEKFNKVILPFLENREGRITNGTNPYFTEGVYDEAAKAVIAGEINDMADLAAFFSERSVDVTKLGEEDAPIQLTNKESLYELLREITAQAKGFRDFLNPPKDLNSRDYQYQKLSHDSSFTTARQEAVANYFYYNYGSFDTVGMANISIEAGTQYLDTFMAAMTSIQGELNAAVQEKKEAAEGGFLDEFLRDKKQSAANGEVFLDYERAEALHANVSKEIEDLKTFQRREIRFEMQTNRALRRVFGDTVGAAIQLLTTGIANLVGTPMRGAMRMQSMFGMNARLNGSFALDVLKEMSKGAATFGIGFSKGALYGLGHMAQLKPRKALIRFVDEFLNQPFVKDMVIGRHKINSTLRALTDAGYGMRIDAQGKIDAYLDSIETRGRIERSDELGLKSPTSRFFSKLYNGAAMFLVEIPGMSTPRLFDAIGNNVSFAWANSAASNIEMRLKDLHRKYGDSLWRRYNDPNSMVKDPNKADTLTPVDVFGEHFFFKANESKLGQLENMFTHAAMDFHAEALNFYKELDTNKDATFLTTDQRAQLGIGLVTSENLATVANRPLTIKNSPNIGLVLALSGWSLSAAHNSVEYLSKSIKGKQGWALDSLNTQLALTALSMAAVSGVTWAGQEELLRQIYKYLFGEVKTGKHPWEADSVGEGSRRALLYALSGFPILNSLPNQFLNDQKNMASMGPDLFVQNKLRDIVNFGGQIANTRNVEGIERALLTYIRQTYPNSRYLVNRIPSIAGTVDIRNNSRLIRRLAPRDVIKVTNYSGGGLTATPLTPMVALMANYATLGEWDLFRDYYKKALVEARRLDRPDPKSYVRSLYFGKDAYRAALKGRPTAALRRKIINQMSEAEREEFLRVENNFYRGLEMIGGSKPSFGVSSFPPSIRVKNRKDSTGVLRRAY